MTKAELIAQMAEKTGLTKRDCEKALTAFTDSVTESLENGDKVQLVGFGTFEVRSRAEKNGVNPQTQERIIIPAGKVPAFRAGSALKEAVEK